ncbi:hypothetical protein ACVR0S_03135 [Streptococcus dentapri]|uniref:Glucosyl transferase n=1 Tax=Streptococcus dentapri TaxID=573564 RepID=A0ABV8D1K8_9STRE
MKNVTSSSWQFAKKYLVQLSCVTALVAAASFISDTASADTLSSDTAGTETVANLKETTSAEKTPAAQSQTTENFSADPVTAQPSQSIGQTESSEGADDRADEKASSSEVVSDTPSVSTSETTEQQEAISVDSWLPADASTQAATEGTATSLTATSEPVHQGFHTDGQGNWYYADEKGNRLTGLQVIDGNTYYFDDKGIQAKGKEAELDGNIYYFDEDNGQRWNDRFRQIDNDVWVYYGSSGARVTGAQTVNQVNLYFNDQGEQVKGDFAADGHYYDKDSGTMLTKRYVEKDGNWYYVDEKGDKLTGAQTIDSVKVYFFADGRQAKGEFSQYGDGGQYYDADSGAQVTDVAGTPRFIQTREGNRYYVNEKGQKVTDLQIIDGNIYYFGSPTRKHYIGAQVRGDLAYAYNDPIPGSSHLYYMDPETGIAWKNRYVEKDGSTYYFGAEGYALTGEQTIDGIAVYFRRDGRQVKGELINENGLTRYYAPDTGERVRNTTKTIDGVTYSFDANGDGTVVTS